MSSDQPNQFGLQSARDLDTSGSTSLDNSSSQSGFGKDDHLNDGHLNDGYARNSHVNDSPPNHSPPNDSHLGSSSQTNPSQDLYKRLLNKGIDLLAMREHSELEIQRKLLSKAKSTNRYQKKSPRGRRKANAPLLNNEAGQVEAQDDSIDVFEIVSSVIDELKSLKYLSNERFTESFIRSREIKGYGPIKIRYELSQKGIVDSMIDMYLDQGCDYWINKASEVCLKKYRNEPISDYNTWSKRARFLQTRGFSFEHIQAAIGEIEYV